jgi:hypothetical protein
MSKWKFKNTKPTYISEIPLNIGDRIRDVGAQSYYIIVKEKPINNNFITFTKKFGDLYGRKVTKNEYYKIKITKIVNHIKHKERREFWKKTGILIQRNGNLSKSKPNLEHHIQKIANRKSRHLKLTNKLLNE